ncbi:MAG: carboxypeptidase-like regulatory domain-containing protein [Bacteroidia bacterium]
MQILRRLICSFLFIQSALTAFSQQGKIAGKVVDAKTGESLTGAIVIIDGTTTGGSADLDGNYSINNLKAGTYDLTCRLISYGNKKIQNVIVTENEVTTLNISLEEPKSDTLAEVVVTVSYNRESASTLLMMQQKSASLSDGVSAEIIKKTPDRNTSDVLRRVSGAAIQDGRFVIIRGLNDRYNSSFLNGAPLPSSESDRKAFAFDIFPSNMLDNIIINKTATPDMPGEFAGGIITINTKSIPDRNFQSFTAGSGYNTLAMGKDRVYYKGGKLDWIGIDDGTRSLPSGIPSNKDFPTLVGQQAALAKQTKNDWELLSSKYSIFKTPNINFQYSMGRVIKRHAKDFFGMILSATYNRNYNFFETIRRSYTNSTDPNVPSQLDFDYLDKTYSTTTLAGGIANFALKLNDNNSFSVKNMYSINSDDRVIARTGVVSPLEENPTLLRSNARWFTSNKLYSGQISGDHFIPYGKFKISWLGSYADIKRDIPDLRRSIYTRLKTFSDPSSPWPLDTVYQASISQSSVGPDYGGGMFYAYTKENIKNGRADISKPLEAGRHIKVELKTGVYTQLRDRSFSARQLGFARYGIPGGSTHFKDSLLYLPENQIFANQNMGLIYPGAGGFKLLDATKPTDAYTASSLLNAAYLMVDARFFEFIRLAGGVRYESFTQKLDALYDNKQPVKLYSQKNDILPSGNLIFSLNKKQNVRLCYSQTLNRPEFRELAPFAFYDFNTQFVFSGYDKLQRAKIYNYDVRYELYPGRGQLFSVTGFYKNFENPIEQITRSDVQGEISYRNAPKAVNSGVEFEFRIVPGALLHTDSCKFLNNLTLFSNLSLIRSKVTLSNNSAAIVKSRQLQGQSPYVFNAGIMYQDNEKGYSVSIMANRVGQRIFIVGNASDPDIWENGRTVIDLQAGKSFFKNKLDVRFNVRDLLAEKLYCLPKFNNKMKGEYIQSQKQYFYQDRNGNQKLDIKKDDLLWVSNFGRVVSLNITWKF